MSAAFTPGPWTVEEAIGSDDKLCFHEIIGGPDGIIASTWAGPNEANARLIAAAPDLLEALCEMKQMLDMVLCVSGGLPPEANGPAAKALAAIGKATGEQQ